MLHPWLSPTAFRAAFARVRENHGCAGADGVTLAQFTARLDLELDALRHEVETGRYWAWPLRKVEVQKRPDSDETRTLLIPAVRDRVLQTAVAAWLEPLLEPEFEECSFGYRRGRSVRMAVEKVHALYEQGYRWVLDADIDSFFDSVDRELLLSRLIPLVPDETVLRLIRLWLDFAVWDGLHVTRPPLGLAQGSVLSPLLANLCLDPLDEQLLSGGWQVVRYADDFVVLARSAKRDRQAHALAAAALAELRLRLHSGKTRVVRYADGFRFLGAIFLKDLLMRPWAAAPRLRRACAIAPPLPDAFFPDSERRPLRCYGALVSSA